MRCTNYLKTKTKIRVNEENIKCNLFTDMYSGSENLLQKRVVRYMRPNVDILVLQPILFFVNFYSRLRKKVKVIKRVIGKLMKKFVE